MWVETGNSKALVTTVLHDILDDFKTVLLFVPPDKSMKLQKIRAIQYLTRLRLTCVSEYTVAPLGEN